MYWKTTCLGILLVVISASVCFAGGVVISEFMAVNDSIVQDENLEYTDWIELHNTSSISVVITGWFLSDSDGNRDKWQFPATTLTADEYLVVFASNKDRTNSGSELHTNFKLSSDGEDVLLVESDGDTISHAYLSYPDQYSDVSYGLTTNVGGQPQYFGNPTPGTENIDPYIGLVDDTKFSMDRGFYTQAFEVALTTLTQGASIRYTTNGSTPTATEGTLYTGAITIADTTILRAMAYKTGYCPTDVDTHTYLFVADVLTQPEMDPSIVGHATYGPLLTNSMMALPVMSLTTDSTNMWGAAGIYDNPGSRGEAWERPVSVEYFTAYTNREFAANGGIRIHGADARGHQKKPFRVFFRSKYGSPSLNFDLFNDPDVDLLSKFVLRPGAHDSWVTPWGSQAASGTYLRDPFMRWQQRLMGQESPHTIFLHLYINGEYWGLYNATERPDSHYCSGHMGGDLEDWDIIQGHGTVEVVDGYMTNWNTAMAMANAGLSDNGDYEAFQEYVDVDSLIIEVITRTYGGDVDWIRSANEIGHTSDRNKNWYSGGSRDGGGFKFFVWDSDFSLGKVHSGSGYTGLNITDVDIANSPGRFYSKLKDNAEFRLRFADAVHKHFFNDGVMTAPALSNRWQEMIDIVYDGMVGESARWGDSVGGPYTRDGNWYSEVAWVKNVFMSGRSETMLEQYELIDLYPATVAPVFDAHGGVFTNSITLTMTAGDSVYYTLDGTDPREYGSGAIQGVLYEDPVVLGESALVKARSRTGSGDWSALNEALFTRALPAQVRVTELMYNPRSPVGAETNNGWKASDYEFIEIMNVWTSTVGLAGISFMDGITLEFPSMGVGSLGPGEYAVVVKNLDAFKVRYTNWEDIVIAGEFEGYRGLPPSTFANNGERVRLVDPAGLASISFTYDDARGWPTAADGAGHSLVPQVTDNQTNGVLDYGGHWRPSAFIDGSPGVSNPVLSASVVINEFMAHTDYTNLSFPDHDSNDWIEFFNKSGSPVSLTNWYLSDDPGDLFKWAIPVTNVIDAGEWMTFDEVMGFHNPTNTGFGLSKDGERLFLSFLPGTAEDRVVDCVRFKAQEKVTSLGRYGDGGRYWYSLDPTTNASNAGPTSHVMITEVMYHPPSTNMSDNEQDEYIEIYNPTDNGVMPFTNSAGAWRIDGGVGFDFPSNTVMQPGDYLVVVSFNPTNQVKLDSFLAAYSLAPGQIAILGPYKGELSNRGERIAVERPQSSDVPDTGPSWVIIDEVIYFDKAPWYSEADGTGQSLQRSFGNGSGNDPDNWYVGFVPTPGQNPAKLALTEPDGGEILFMPFEVWMEVNIDLSQVTGVLDHVSYLVNGVEAGSRTGDPFDRYLLDSVAAGITTAGNYTLSAELTDESGTYTSMQTVVSVLGIDNGAGATNVADMSVNMEARLSGVGSAALSICWGETDGGTNILAWDNTRGLGVVSNGTYAIYADDLQPGRRYYYRCYAQNGERDGWSSGAAQFTTKSYTDWAYRARIDFDGYGGTQTLTGFPAVIVLGTGITGFDYADCSSGSGADIRIADSTGTNWLPREVDGWDTNGDSFVWARLPELNTGTYVWVYWGNSSAINQPASQSDGSVWTEGFLGVWHMQTTNTFDSTANHSPSISGDVVADTGMIGRGIRFDGDDYVLVTDFPKSVDELTLTAWGWADAVTNRATILRNWGVTNVGQFELALHPSVYDVLGGIRQSDNVAVSNRTGSKGGKWLAEQWMHIAFTADGSSIQLYRNGVLKGGSNAYDGSLATDFAPLGIGARPGDDGGSAGSGWQGILDEIRVSDVGRSFDWVTAERENALGTIATYRIAESVPQPGGGDTNDVDEDGMADAWEVLFFGGTNMSMGGPDDDWDSDGYRNLYEYTAGTVPTNGLSLFQVRIVHTNGETLVVFDGLDADGTGYLGVDRYYDLSRSVDLRGQWSPVVGFTNIVGDDSTVIHTNQSGGKAFFRVKARLQ